MTAAGRLRQHIQYVNASNWLTHLEYEWRSGELSIDRWTSDLESVFEAAQPSEPVCLLGISQGAEFIEFGVWSRAQALSIAAAIFLISTVGALNGVLLTRARLSPGANVPAASVVVHGVIAVLPLFPFFRRRKRLRAA